MATAAATAEESEPRGFLDLPPELRDTIYSLVLEYGKTINLTRDYNRSERPRRWYPQPTLHLRNINLNLSPALLATCKEIHSEATPILYGSNCICFEADLNKPIFKFFLGTIHDSARYLHNLEFIGERTKLQMRANFRILRKIAPMLNKLTLGFEYCEAFSPEQMALALRPLIRTTDKRDKANTQTKDTDVLDKLHFTGHDHGYGDKVKDVHRTMLK